MRRRIVALAAASSVCLTVAASTFAQPAAAAPRRIGPRRTQPITPRRTASQPTRPSTPILHDVAPSTPNSARQRDGRWTSEVTIGPTGPKIGRDSIYFHVDRGGVTWVVSTMFNLKCRYETGIPYEITWGASDYERVAILTSGGHAVLPIDGYDALLHGHLDLDFQLSGTTGSVTMRFRPTDPVDCEARSVTIPVGWRSALGNPNASVRDPLAGAVVVYRANGEIQNISAFAVKVQCGLGDSAETREVDVAIPDLHIPVDTPFSRQIEVPGYSVTIANIPAPSVGQHQGVVVNVYAPGPPACFGFTTT